MSWWQIPSSVRTVLLGFLIGAFLASQGHAGLGAAFFIGLSCIGLIADGIRHGWRLYWNLTLECAWCRARINRFFARNKLVSRELHGQEHWYCSPRCYTEWHRRHYTERKQFNLLNEGGPLVQVGK
jgi:hypothetical protein